MKVSREGISTSEITVYDERLYNKINIGKFASILGYPEQIGRAHV